MRIEELLVEQQLDELGIPQGIKNAASAVGKGVVGAAKAIGKNAPGFIQGVGDIAGATAGAITQPMGAAAGGLMKGYQQARRGQASTNQDQNTDPAAGDTNTTAPAANTTAPVAGGTAPVAPTPAQQQQAAQQAKIGIGQINKIIPTLKTDQLNAIKKVIDQRTQALAAKRTGQQNQQNTNTAANQAGQQNQQNTNTAVQTQTPNTPPPANPNWNTAGGGAARTFESVEFHSKFLNQKI